jgi:hypothetical protein
VLSYKDSQGINIFAELTYTAISMLTLPHSNAEIERLFSQMNVVKNKLRNRLKLPMLNAILTIRSGLKRFNKCCHNYPLSNDLIKKIKTKETYSLELEPDDDFEFELANDF